MTDEERQREFREWFQRCKDGEEIPAQAIVNFGLGRWWMFMPTGVADTYIAVDPMTMPKGAMDRVKPN